MYRAGDWLLCMTECRLNDRLSIGTVPIGALLQIEAVRGSCFASKWFEQPCVLPLENFVLAVAPNPPSLPTP